MAAATVHAQVQAARAEIATAAVMVADAIAIVANVGPKAIVVVNAMTAADARKTVNVASVENVAPRNVRRRHPSVTAKRQPPLSHWPQVTQQA